MTPPSRPSRAPTIFAAAVLLLAVFLRLHRLDLMEYKYDQIVAMMMGRDIVEGRHFHLHGLASSIGVHNPGLFVWIMAVAVALHDSPLFAAGMIAGLNVLALALFYVLFRRRWPEPVVLTALLLFAACPWALLTSRCIWAQDLLPVFMVPFAYYLLEYLDHRAPRHGIAAVVLLGLAAQIHLSALFVAPGVLILLARRRLLFHRAIWRSAGIVLLTLVPFFVHLARDWDHTRAVMQGARAAAPPGDILGLMLYGLRLSGGLDLAENALGNDATRFIASDPRSQFAMQSASVLVLILAAIGLIAAFARRLPNPLAADARRGALLIAGLWLGYWFAGVPRYPHYAIILYPWPFVFAAAGAWFAVAWLRTPAARAVGTCGIATAVVAAHVAFTAAFARYIDTHPMTGTEYGIPFRDVPPSLVALALVNAGRHDRAIPEFRRALQADPTSAALASDLAWSLAQTGDPRGAVDLLDRTITSHADDKAPRRRLIVLLATNPNVRDTARALALAEDGVLRRPRIPEDYFNRAIALCAAGRRGDAIAAMEDLLAHLPVDHADRPRFQRYLAELQVVH